MHPAEASHCPAAGLLMLSVPALCSRLSHLPPSLHHVAGSLRPRPPYVSHTEASIWSWSDVHGEEGLPVEGLLNVIPGHRSGDMTKGGERGQLAG